MDTIRQSAVAGRFYPEDKLILQSEIQEMLRFDDEVVVFPKALIVPHAGYVYSGPIAASAYASIKKSQFNHVVLVGPSHYVSFHGIAMSSAQFFESPLGQVPLNRDVRQCLLNLPFVHEDDGAHEQEHSLEVQLPFLQEVLGDFTLTPLVVGHADVHQVAEALEKLWGDEQTLLVISSDLSHYHSYQAACNIDREACDAIESLNVQALDRDMACGCIAIQGLLEVASRKGMALKLVDYRNSGDTAGDKTRVVGYAACLCVPQSDITGIYSLNEKKAMMRFVRTAIAEKLGVGTSDGTEEFIGDVQKSTFVTLTLNGQLRGCIGSLNAHRSLTEDLYHNAQAAAFDDPRFSPLQKNEFDNLEIHISILSDVYDIEFSSEKDLLSQLLPGKDGLILSEGFNRGTFLPSVWEQLPDPELFLNSLKAKAGLPQGYWSNTLRIQRYRTSAFSDRD